MKVQIKVNGAKYFLCKSCGVYKKDKFNGKLNKRKFCTPCLSDFTVQKTTLK
jgi:hypothetical protein